MKDPNDYGSKRATIMRSRTGGCAKVVQPKHYTMAPRFYPDATEHAVTLVRDPRNTSEIPDAQHGRYVATIKRHPGRTYSKREIVRFARMEGRK